jgi:hypothetical protein
LSTTSAVATGGPGTAVSLAAVAKRSSASVRIPFLASLATVRTGGGAPGSGSGLQPSVLPRRVVALGVEVRRVVEGGVPRGELGLRLDFAEVDGASRAEGQERRDLAGDAETGGRVLLEDELEDHRNPVRFPRERERRDAKERAPPVACVREVERESGLRPQEEPREKEDRRARDAQRPKTLGPQARDQAARHERRKHRAVPPR